MTMTMKMKKTSLSNDQNKLKILCDLVCDDIENLLKSLAIEDYKMLDKMVMMSCPIHSGDNTSAFNLYHTGDDYRGNWKCRTHQCERTFKSSILGFIRGRLSRIRFGWENEGDKTVTFQEAINYASSFVNKDLDSIKVSRKEVEKNSFVNAVKHLTSSESPKTNRVSRNLICKSLEIPSSYFVSRGFSAEILTKYDVGECVQPGKEMCDRAVVPVYDAECQYMIGCSGRSTLPKCDKCNLYHNSDRDCPDKYEEYLFKKWRHNKGFPAEDNLYNFWYAKEFIKKSGSIVLVESPGNVWRLEEAGIHNSVALFGSSLKDKQRMLLDISGAMNIITIMDKDIAGDKGKTNIEEKCKRTYNIRHIDIGEEYPDVAEMTVEEINNKVKPIIERFNV